MTHAHIAYQCTEPIRTWATTLRTKADKLPLEVAIAETEIQIAIALADQRRAELRETANRLAAFDGTPHRPKEPKA